MTTHRAHLVPLKLLELGLYREPQITAAALRNKLLDVERAHSDHRHRIEHKSSHE